ncbi:hypothetical protein AOC36_03985 [Erysipelothrix larvae]|uniref:Prepilin-type N-terminal cleavage/methylation domain-containing protein n=1 Tax=Erysipelothrix larvae TaxID=1514105 RepID=A0A0X8GZ80_9FIRM|nr:type II secretion system protein [Erysipelothrix larvae]AMC93159.1 hypothetical protein AOC36_03985 [Erysipelothrix larvae]
MKKGFTLIEVVVALALLIIVVAVVSTAFALTGRVNAAANQKITAQQVAVNATEELRYLAINESTDKDSLLVSLSETDLFGTYNVLSAV